MCFLKYKPTCALPQEPENIDKEFLRLWFRARCDPYKDKVLPEAPKELVVELSKRCGEPWDAWLSLLELSGPGGGLVGAATGVEAFRQAQAYCHRLWWCDAKEAAGGASG